MTKSKAQPRNSTFPYGSLFTSRCPTSNPPRGNHLTKSLTILSTPSTRPPCHCNMQHLPTWSMGGTSYTIDNHFCLLPVTIPFKGQPLIAKDPLPCPGLKRFHEASTHLKRLCSFLQTPSPNVHSFITPSQFPESGDLCTMVLTIAETLSKVAVIRVADKSAAMLWGFCAALVWDNVDRFLISENYTPLPFSSSDAVKGNLSSAIQAHHWPLNKNASIPLLCILAKAKSLTKQMIVWHPITAVVQPFILRHWLRLAARGFTFFLKTLKLELPACFLHIHITDLAEWVSPPSLLELSSHR